MSLRTATSRYMSLTASEQAAAVVLFPAPPSPPHVHRFDSALARLAHRKIEKFLRRLFRSNFCGLDGQDFVVDWQQCRRNIQCNVREWRLERRRLAVVLNPHV